MQMSNIKLYCILEHRYGTLGNEKASICGRGLIGGAWERLNDSQLTMTVTITSQDKKCNFFVGCYV